MQLALFLAGGAPCFKIENICIAGGLLIGLGFSDADF
jgi:hypothetical protein